MASPHTYVHITTIMATVNMTTTGTMDRNLLLVGTLGSLLLTLRVYCGYMRHGSFTSNIRSFSERAAWWGKSIDGRAHSHGFPLRVCIIYSPPMCNTWYSWAISESLVHLVQEGGGVKNVMRWILDRVVADINNIVTVYVQ